MWLVLMVLQANKTSNDRPPFTFKSLPRVASLFAQIELVEKD